MLTKVSEWANWENRHVQHCHCGEVSGTSRFRAARYTCTGFMHTLQQCKCKIGTFLLLCNTSATWVAWQNVSIMEKTFFLFILPYTPHANHPWKPFSYISQFWLTPFSAHVFTCISPQSILMLSLRLLVKKTTLTPSIKSWHDALRRRNLNELRFRRHDLHVSAAKEACCCIRCDGASHRCARQQGWIKTD